MTLADSGFQSRIISSDGYWPEPPDIFSYSTLREIERCPNQWMLRRAHFPDIWNGHGYPDLPSLPALFGKVLHSTLETVIAALVECGCDNSSSPEAVDVLRTLGGFTAIITSTIAVIDSALESNPRSAHRAAGFVQGLGARTPELRRRAQAMLARTRLVSRRTERSPDTATKANSRPLGNGSHAEVLLRANEIGWVGRVDLLTVDDDACQIVDYKTGAEHETHREQVRVYALLWSLDETRNPNGRLATELVVAYPDRDEHVEAPDEAELQAIRANIETRTLAARGELAQRPPHATPHLETCPFCPVRHLCESYWVLLGEAAPSTSTAPVDGFGDFELIVSERNGPRSWLCHSTGQVSEHDAERILVFARNQQFSLEPGAKVRLLNGRFHRDPEERTVTVTVGEASEIHTLSS
jgi:hypothetical protein